MLRCRVLAEQGGPRVFTDHLCSTRPYHQIDAPDPSDEGEGDGVSGVVEGDVGHRGEGPLQMLEQGARRSSVVFLTAGRFFA